MYLGGLCAARRSWDVNFPDNRVFDLISINLHLTLLLTRNDKVHITIACKIEQAPTLEQIPRVCVSFVSLQSRFVQTILNLTGLVPGV
jgi:hypothetical protein